MSDVQEITPEELFEAVKKDPEEVGWDVRDKAYERYKSVENKSTFLEPIINFVKDAKFEEERTDAIRSWGTTFLGFMSGKDAEVAMQFLIRLLKEESSPELAREFYWTRFYALRSLWYLAKNPKEKEDLLDVLLTFAFSDEEDFVNQAEACVLIVLHETSPRKDRNKASRKIRDMLSASMSKDGKFKGFGTKSSLGDFWPAYRALDALREFPLPNVLDGIIKVMKESPYSDHKINAIQVLGGYREDEIVVHELGFIVRRNKDFYLRQLAVISLGKIKRPDATEYLLRALVDDNAETRVQASKALESTLPDKSTALRMIIEEAMKAGIEDPDFGYLVEALRAIDQNRDLCGSILAKELESDDPKRAQLAQKILYDIGGVEALQKLNRRKTLEKSYELLDQSEKGLQNAFQETTLQAKRNFYFAMIINAIIVGVGIALIGLAISQVLSKPENFAGWITPGAGGVFGIILTMYFNGPRKNAQQDLRVLMNANIIYLGFLRMLNEIDATFKHDYVENPSFGAENMTKTVLQINESLQTVLKLTATHLFPTEETETNQVTNPKTESEKPQQPTVVTPS
jgi:hypothetical protein